MEKILRIDYDANVLNVMDKVNAILEPYGYQFVNDDQPHDGYEIYTLLHSEAPKS